MELSAFGAMLYVLGGFSFAAIILLLVFGIGKAVVVLLATLRRIVWNQKEISDLQVKVELLESKWKSLDETVASMMDGK